MKDRIYGIETEFGCLPPDSDPFLSPDFISVKTKDYVFYREGLGIVDGSSFEDAALTRHKNIVWPALLDTDFSALPAFVALSYFRCQGFSTHIIPTIPQSMPWRNTPRLLPDNTIKGYLC